MRKLVAGIATILLSLTTSVQVWAWGATGHRLVAEVSAQLSDPKSFWRANEKNLGTLTNVPDNSWKAGKSAVDERPTHFFEPDAYFSSPQDFVKFPRKWTDALNKYGNSKVTAHGTAVWRVQQLYNLSVAKAVKADYKGSLEMAGTMSHYVGDLSQPLHVTTNYDGQETKQNGIHKFFETTNLEGRDYAALKADVLKRARLLLKDPEFLKQNSLSLENVVFNLVNRSYDYKSVVLDIDLQSGRTGAGAVEMFELAKDQMADGAATMAIILSSAWKAAGSPAAAQSVQITVPPWVAVDYTALRSNRYRTTRVSTAKPVSFFDVQKYAPDAEADCE